MVAAIAGAALLLALAGLTALGPIAFALSGFALAPIFSATLIWVGSALPTSAHANAIVIGGALLGAAVFPALIGRVIDRLGAAAAPPAILVLALAALRGRAVAAFRQACVGLRPNQGRAASSCAPRRNSVASSP